MRHKGQTKKLAGYLKLMDTKKFCYVTVVMLIEDE